MPLEEYRRLNPRRPITDRAIGSHTADKRIIDARRSAIHEVDDGADAADRSIRLQELVRQRKAEREARQRTGMCYRHARSKPCIDCHRERKDAA